MLDSRARRDVGEQGVGGAKRQQANAALGYFVFREPFSRWRLTATVCAVSGIVAIRLGG
ncbi:MAG TPA: hypothetical protein VIP50_05325 [Agromyces sp.]